MEWNGMKWKEKKNVSGYRNTVAQSGTTDKITMVQSGAANKLALAQ